MAPYCNQAPKSIMCSRKDFFLTMYQIIHFLTLSQTTNFRLFQTGRVADDTYKVCENDRKVSKMVENTVEKGEIAR